MMHGELPGAERVEGTEDAELALVVRSEVTKRGEENLHGAQWGTVPEMQSLDLRRDQRLDEGQHAPAIALAEVLHGFDDEAAIHLVDLDLPANLWH